VFTPPPPFFVPPPIRVSASISAVAINSGKLIYGPSFFLFFFLFSSSQLADSDLHSAKIAPLLSPPLRRVRVAARQCRHADRNLDATIQGNGNPSAAPEMEMRMETATGRREADT